MISLMLFSHSVMSGCDPMGCSTYLWNQKSIKNESIWRLETHRHRKQTYRYQGRKIRGEEQIRSIGLTDTLPHIY